MVLDTISFLTCLTSLCNANFCQAEEYTEKKYCIGKMSLYLAEVNLEVKRM